MLEGECGESSKSPDLSLSPAADHDPSPESPRDLEAQPPAGGRLPKKVAKVRPNPRPADGLGLGLPENHRIVVGPGKGGASSPHGLPGPPSPIFESGVNTEYIQLLRQLWNVHEEAVEFLAGLGDLLAACRARARLQQHQAANDPKKGPKTTAPKRKEDLTPLEAEEGGGGARLLEEADSWPALQPFIHGLNSITESISDMEKQYNGLAVFQFQCKLVLYAKVLHARKHVIHDQLSILHTVSLLIPTALQILSSATSWSEPGFQANLLTLFQLAEVYNGCLEGFLYSPPPEEPGQKPEPSIPEPEPPNPAASPDITATNFKPVSEGTKVRILKQVLGVSRNDSPSLRLSLKPFSASKLLGLFAQTRLFPATQSFVEVIQRNFLRSGSRPGPPTPDPSSLSLTKFEAGFLAEDARLGPFGRAFSQTPGLLGRAAVKRSESGDQRLTKSVRTKMYNYYRQTLWTLVGETSQDLLLWAFESALPLVLFPVDTFVVLSNSLALSRRMAEPSTSPLLSAFDSVSGALHSFTLLLSWDENMRKGFVAAGAVKRPEQLDLVRSPEPGQWATQIGERFGEIITTGITLIDGEDSKLLFGLQNEEEPLSDEAQTLFRLQATLSYYTQWVLKRSKAWLNAWAIPQFLACSQRDAALLVQLVKSRESILITREILLTSENTSVRLSAKQRQMCADDLREALRRLETMPDELLQAVGPVCRTLSLATFQSHFPPPPHWRGIGPGSGLDPDKPSAYVQVFIDRVIQPVIVASVEFVYPKVQEAVGKQAIHAGCEAWLQYILQRQIRFSEWGAVQLLRDFMSLRDWIRNETGLHDEARKAILQLEILKRCEGVAYLLLRSPGDVLGVGKPSRRTRRVSSNVTQGGGRGSRESSPSVSENSIAEDDIPPEMYVPNQQMWLELRLRRNGFSSCCQ